MKRAALSFLVLAGLVLLSLGLRQTLQGDASGSMGTDPAAPRSRRGEEDSTPGVVSDRTPPLEPRNSRSRTLEGEVLNSPVANDDPGVESPVTDLPADELPVDELPADELPTDEPAEARPPNRYQDDDALAMRRGRQIELVTEAQRQARESLAAAEERGDTEVAARTRGVMRRLQLRLDALEAAASAVEPY